MRFSFFSLVGLVRCEEDLPTTTNEKAERGLEAPVRKAVPRPLCVWDEYGGAANECRANYRYVCEVWRELKDEPPFEAIDKYTRFYYDTLCETKHSQSGRRCVDIDTMEACEPGNAPKEEGRGGDFGDDQADEDEDEDGSSIRPDCNWAGDEELPMQPWGSCRGGSFSIRELVREMSKMDKHGLVSKQALFSYAINQFDCHDICMNSCLGLLPGHCPTLKYCCEWSGKANRCVSSNLKISKRYNPRLNRLAALEFACLENSGSWEDCASVSADRYFKNPTTKP